MSVRRIEKTDYEPWRELAREMEELFQGEMAENPDFFCFMKRKIDAGEALVFDERESGEFAGVLAYSVKKNEISWFAVPEKYRGKGAGSALLQAAVERLDEQREIVVTTFREGEPGGEAARRLYSKFGFRDELLTYHHGQPRTVMKRPPHVRKEAENGAD